MGKNKHLKDGGIIFSKYRYHILVIAVSAVTIALFANIFLRFTIAAAGEEKPVVIIDAGHGGEDGGAVGQNGTDEKEINLAISEKLRDILTLSGYDTVMIRKGDHSVGDRDLESVAERKRSDIKFRTDTVNSYDKAIVISIHQNYFEQERYSGTQVFYADSKGSSQLAECIQEAVVSMLQAENTRQIKGNERGIYLLKNSINPCVIVECGFISNYDECRQLCESSYQLYMAYSIASGIDEFLRLTL